MVMSSSEFSNIELFNSDIMFNKPIYFKIYELEGNIGGEIDHTHDYMQIWYVRKGMCSHWINGKEHRMVKGDMFILPPYVVHKVRPIEGEDIHITGCEFSARFLNNKFDDFTKSREFFDFAYLEPFLVSEDMVKPKLKISGEAQTVVENILKGMVKEYNTENKYFQMIIKADLLKLLTVIAREYSNNCENRESEELFEKYRSAITDAIKYIHENFCEDLHLEDICKRSMMSKSYFCYIFKHLTGKTFTEYVIHLRIQKAINLLDSTSTTVTKICYEVGFNDVTHFCRTFKKMVGVSPKYYRKAAL